MRTLLVAALLLFVSVSAAAEQRNITVDNLRRMYLIERPTTCAAGRLPAVLLWFHGFRDGSAQTAHDEHALHVSGECAIVVYPQACPTYVSANCRTTGGWSMGGEWGAVDRDLRFVDAVLADVRARNATDGRAFIGGMSRGCYFTYYLAHARDDYQRVACVAGALNGTMVPPTVAEPLLHIQDPADGLNCWATMMLTCRVLNDIQTEAAEPGFNRWQSWAPSSMVMLVDGVGHTFQPDYRPLIWDWMLRQ